MRPRRVQVIENRRSVGLVLRGSRGEVIGVAGAPDFPGALSQLAAFLPRRVRKLVRLYCLLQSLKKGKGEGNG